MPKKFIEKKKVLYSTPLLHRSQQDPLIADESAPNRVLNPVKEEETAKERKKRIKEQQKYGIFFKDDENYLQYLKDVNDHTLEWPANADEEIEAEIARRKAKLNLPVEVFPSEKEDAVGMLNRAMPVSGLELNLDSDIVAAMDEDFDFDDPNNQLEDNFIELANGEQVNSKEEHEEDDYFSCSDFEEESEDVDELKSFPNFEKEEVKSRFTDYPMSSSVLKRNEHLRLLDAKFEKLYADFNDDKIGAPDSDEETNYTMSERDSSRLLEMAKQYEKSLEKVHLPEKDEMSVAKTKELIANMSLSSEIESEEENEYIEDLENEDFHPTTSMNIKYEPALISMSNKNKIEVNKYTGVPKGVLGQDKLTLAAVNCLTEKCRDCDSKKIKSAPAKSVISHLSALSLRPKNETSEEKRERKKELKEYRRERVREKKLNKLAFKEETQRQKKNEFSNRRNVQGKRLL